MIPEGDFVNSYFTEERIQSLIILSIGIISVLLACIFLFIIKYSFFKGLAIPLLLIGFLQLTVGGVIFYRSPGDNHKVRSMLLKEPHKINTEELTRIDNVIKRFTVYKWIEIIVLIISIILIIRFYNSHQTFWKGFGLGFLLQACLLLTIDSVAEKRALIYKENLIHFYISNK